jgi:predicted ABC-type ATPase
MTANLLDHRPIVVALAGPNGAGKTTYYDSHMERTGLRFVNADTIARELKMDAYSAASVADLVRQELVRQNESFVFETVFSDPVGDKLEFLKSAARAGYTVVLYFIGISSAEMCGERVGMRVSQGGHDVPKEKLVSRFPRILANLKSAIRDLPNVWIFDNDDLALPYRLAAVCEGGKLVRLNPPTPRWLKPLLPKER